MEKTTNINIKNDNKIFTYIIGYDEISDISYNMKSFPLGIKIDNDLLYLIGKETNADRYNNEWERGGYNSELQTTYIPNTYKLMKLKLYFPNYSVNTYKYVKYALSAYTFIRGVKIILGNYIIGQEDSLADSIKRINENIYCQSIEFKIINPRNLIYSDDWKDFRENLCGEISVTASNLTPNNECPSVFFSLYPINENVHGKYNTASGYEGGQNSIVINRNEHLSINIKPELNPYSDLPFQITGKLIYNNEFSTIVNYINQTYNLEISNKQLFYELVIGDKSNLYLKTARKYIIDNEQNIDENVVFNRNEISFDKWTDTGNLMELSGISIICLLYVENGKNTIIFKSNKIPVTQEIFKYLIGDNPNLKIDKKIIDDMSININTVNKIINNVVQVDKLKDSKTNIIQPVFFRTHELGNVVIHPDVTENICLNLDLYKSKVDTFVIQINGKSFVESGRTSAGVIFKIIGGKLGKTQQSTIYYILNEKGEVITSGKYKFEM